MQLIQKEPNAKISLLRDGFNYDLVKMTGKLENSRRILLDLLETKRNKFPRFYFLPNDDLFEVLG
jgi:dynein heavy chain